MTEVSIFVDFLGLQNFNLAVNLHDVNLPLPNTVGDERLRTVYYGAFMEYVWPCNVPYIC